MQSDRIIQREANSSSNNSSSQRARKSSSQDEMKWEKIEGKTKTIKKISLADIKKESAVNAATAAAAATSAAALQSPIIKKP